MLQLALWFVTVWGIVSEMMMCVAVSVMVFTVWGIGREMMMCVAVSVMVLTVWGSEGKGDVCCS